MCAPVAKYASAHRRDRAATILIVGGARALGRYHARADRTARRACSAEDCTIGGFLHTADDRRALAGRVLRRLLHLDGKAPFGVVFSIGGFNAQSAVRQFPQAAPLEAWTEFKYLGDQTLRLGVTVASNSARELILDAAAAGIQLLHQHADCLHYVERLAAGDHDRALILLGEILIRSAANHGADMGGS